MMRVRSLTVLITAMGMVLPVPAWADAATHTLVFTSVRDEPPGCAGPSCAPRCLIRASLTNHRRASPPITVRLVYPSGPRPEPEAELALEFPAVAINGVQRASVETNRRCANLRVNKVEAFCPEARDRCPGFFYIQVPDVPRLGLRRQKVEAH